MKIYRLIKQHISKNKRHIAFYIFISVILSFLGLVMPYLSGMFIDDLIQNPSLKVIYNFTFLIIIVSILQLVFSYVASVLCVKLKTKLSYSFNKEIIIGLQNVSLLYLDGKNAAYLNQRVNADCSNLINFSMMFLNGGIVNLITFAVCFVVIVGINAKISFIILALIIAYFILFRVMHRPLTTTQYRLKEVTAKYISRLQEQLQDVRIIKTFNMFDFFSDRMDNCFDEYMESSVKTTKLGYVFKSSDIMIKMISQVLLFLIGGYQILHGKLSIGLFTVLSSYFGNLVNSAKFFMNVINQYIINAVSADRLIEIQKVEKEPNGYVRLDDIQTIRTNNLKFSYNEHLVLSDFCCNMKKGNLYKVCGENGKGKSTLISLLIGLYPNEYHGEIYYNDTELMEMDGNYMRKSNISYIGQEYLFFKGTICENLTFGDSDFDLESVKKHLEDFTFESYLDMEADDFLNTELNDTDSNLSGGELKKLAIIRGLIKPSSILVLDEPGNSLDHTAKASLKKILMEKKKDMIVILVSHDDCFDSVVDYEISLDGD